MIPQLLAAVVSTAALPLVPAAAAPGGARHVQTVELTIVRGDRATEPNFALAPGLPVRVTVTNRTHELHTFTVPALGVSRLILPARKTTFVFVPDRAGSFVWHCAICPSGLHGSPHEMGGKLYLIVEPSALG